MGTNSPKVFGVASYPEYAIFRYLNGPRITKVSPTIRRNA